MMKKILLPISIVVLMSLSACQSQDNNSTKMLDQSPIGVPSSNGPTESPNVNGPTTPPPGQNSSENTENNSSISTPQAMTEKENIKIVLPEDNR